MLAPDMRVTLVDPNGSLWDLTERCLLDSIDEVTEETESDLLQLTHSDMDLDFDDRDGVMSALFTGCARGQVFEVWIERETGQRRPKYARIFAGVVDIPQGVRFDRREKVVSVQVFSYSKLAEFYSAENIARTFATLVGSSTSGSAVLSSITSTVSMVAGDILNLDDGAGVTQDFTVQTVDSATQVTATAVASSTTTAGTLTVTTPYYRNYTVNQLAALLFAEAGITEYNVDIAQELASLPFPSTPTTSGLPSTVPLAILETTGNKLGVYSGTTVHRYDASNVTGGFSDAGATGTCADWRPYRTTTPAALRTTTRDDGTKAWDYDGNHYYTMVSTGSPVTLTLQKDGVSIATLDTAPAAPGYSHQYKYVEYDPTSGYVYVSFARLFEDPAEPGVPGVLSNYTTARYTTAGVLVDTLASAVCRLRACKTTAGVAVFYGSAVGDEYPITFNGSCRVLDTNAATLVTLASKEGVIGWTFRAMQTFYCAVRQQAGKTYVTVWNQSDGSLAADYQISTTTSNYNFGTVFDAGASITPYYWAYGGGVHYIVSTAFSGVIPYADFSGLSVAAALKQLALISGSHFYVDAYKTGNLLGRKSATLVSQIPKTIPDPLTQVEMPVWEWLRLGVHLTGKDEFGADIETSVGSLGDSAAVLDVSLKMPITSGLATAVANAYYQYLSTSRGQWDEDIPEPADGPVSVLDLVERDGREYRVLRAATNYLERRQTVQLVESP